MPKSPLSEDFATLSGSFAVVDRLPGLAYRCLCTPLRPLVYASEGCLALTGYSSEALTGAAGGLAELVHPEDRDRVWNGIQAAGDAAYDLEYRIVTPDGGVKWVRDKGVRHESGASACLDGILLDLSANRLAVEPRQESQSRLELTMESLLEGCQIVSRDWRYVYVNATAARQGRKSREELLGRRMEECYPGIEQSPVFSSFQYCMNERKSCRLENRFVFPDGSVGWFDLSVEPVPDGIFILSVDVTDRRRMELSLQESMERTNLLNERLECLQQAVRQLAAARSLPDVMAVVRTTARQLTGADGATFVLRDGDRCFYADEEAIAPLWKGQRFPMSACISGWAMMHNETVIIEDIYADSRIPAAAYRPTFVKSLAMVPIRSTEPIGAIGSYWARQHRPADDEIGLLMALADAAAVAIQNVQAYELLEQRVAERTAQLQAANQELETFAYSVSHDLRAPLRSITGFSRVLLEDYGTRLDAEGQDSIQRVCAAATRMGRLIDDLLEFSRMGRAEMSRRDINLSAIAASVAESLRAEDPARQVDLTIAPDIVVQGDSALLRVALQNLLGNAWKFTSRRERAHIEFKVAANESLASPHPDLPPDTPICVVTDDGAGFDMHYAGKLFGPFQRLHDVSEFPGTGIGLATVQRIVHRHGGVVWAVGKVNRGATVCFTLPPPETELSNG